MANIMKITLRQLEAFASVLKVGTATAAANVLNTSQPSVTRCLKQLEDATGLVLFERRNGRLIPTAEAEALMDHVEANFAGLARIEQTAATIARQKKGSLRIGCLPAFAQGFMARVFAQLATRKPEISLTLLPMVARDLAQAIRERSIDVGLVAYELNEPALSVSRFTDLDEVALLPAGHSLAARTMISLSELRDERLILTDATDPYRQRLAAVIDPGAAARNVTVETPTSHGVCAMVAQGLGIGIVNPITALEFSHAGLAMVSLAERLPFVTSLVAPRSMRPSDNVSIFIDTLIAERDRSLAETEERCRRSIDRTH
jgi:DNA-binding transcriptional LysR family regulator